MVPIGIQALLRRALGHLNPYAKDREHLGDALRELATAQSKLLAIGIIVGNCKGKGPVKLSTQELVSYRFEAVDRIDQVLRRAG